MFKVDKRHKNCVKSFKRSRPGVSANLFTSCSSVPIVDFEQVNICYYKEQKLKESFKNKIFF